MIIAFGAPVSGTARATMRSSTAYARPPDDQSPAPVYKRPDTVSRGPATPRRRTRQLAIAAPVALEVRKGTDGTEVEAVKGTAGARRFHPVAGGSRVPVQQVACGARHALYLCRAADAGGDAPWTQVRAVGDNARGQLGTGARRAAVRSAVLPFFAQPAMRLGVRQLAAGGDFSLAVLNDGRALAWGANGAGQLGLGLLGLELQSLRHGYLPARPLPLSRTSRAQVSPPSPPGQTRLSPFPRAPPPPPPPPLLRRPGRAAAAFCSQQPPEPYPSRR